MKNLLFVLVICQVIWAQGGCRELSSAETAARATAPAYWVLTRLENFLLYSFFQRLTNWLI